MTAVINANSNREEKMEADKYDVLIIGAGHNGLVLGCYLAKAGLKVCVI